MLEGEPGFHAGVPGAISQAVGRGMNGGFREMEERSGGCFALETFGADAREAFAVVETHAEAVETASAGVGSPANWINLDRPLWRCPAFAR